MGAAHTVVLGGNLSAASELGVTTTVLGHAFDTLARDRVRVGHFIYVTGRLGASGAALRALLAGAAPDPVQRARFAHPVARIAEGRLLIDAGAVAAIDISDGLASYARHLAAASGLSIELDLGELPLATGVSAIDAATSGEEYELLVAAPRPLDAEAFALRFGIPLTRVGQAVAGEPPDVVLLDAGRRVAPLTGHDHFWR